MSDYNPCCLCVVFTFVLDVTPVPDSSHNGTSTTDMPSKEYTYFVKIIIVMDPSHKPLMSSYTPIVGYGTKQPQLK